LTKFKALGIKTALWTTDAPRPEFRQVIATAPCYDHIFCAGTEAMDILSAEGRLNTVWLPFACDPELHRPVELRDEDQSLFPEDIVFVGAYYPNRWQILKEIVGKYNIAIYGPGWQVVIDNRNRHAIHAGPVPPSTWVKMYSAARIILIIHYQDGVTPCFQASPKIFEAMSCRGFVITDVQKDVQTLFTSGRHLVSFADIDDLKDKIDFYLENEARRRLIADQGYEEVRRRHTYRHRMQTIIEHASLPS